MFFIVVALCLLILVGAVILNETANPGKPKTVGIPAPAKKSERLIRSKTDIHLTIRTIIRWEQLRGKSFSEMNYEDNDDLTALLYCSVISCNPNTTYTLAEFRHVTSNEKLIREMSQKLSRESLVMAQFREVAENSADIGNSEGSSGRISEIVSTLIVSGLDAGYVMDKMGLCDLPIFIRAYEQQKKEQLENNRLWTYLSILPHVDGKKLPSAVDLYPFPWELEEMKRQAEEALQADANRFEDFMTKGHNLIIEQYGR